MGVAEAGAALFFADNNQGARRVDPVPSTAARSSFDLCVSKFTTSCHAHLFLLWVKLEALFAVAHKVAGFATY